MKSFPRLTLVFLGVVASASAALGASGSAANAPKKVLYFTKSSGYEHSVVKQNAGNPSFSEQVLAELGKKHNIEFTHTKDGSLFTPEYLDQFDAFFFYATGDLTALRNTPEQGDDNPPMTQAGKEAFLKAIENGKGFIGAHSATDAFHSPGSKLHGEQRWKADGDKADPYIKMIGGEFTRHAKQQEANQVVADPNFPGVSEISSPWRMHEEWYAFKNLANDLHVILYLDTNDMVGPEYQRPAYPSTWARMHGKGRVFYTAMGHREDVWLNPAFQSVLMGGINWALGRVDVDVTPNLAKVTPEAHKIPDFVPPPSAAPAPAAKK